MKSYRIVFIDGNRVNRGELLMGKGCTRSDRRHAASKWFHENKESLPDFITVTEIAVDKPTETSGRVVAVYELGDNYSSTRKSYLLEVFDRSANEYIVKRRVSCDSGYVTRLGELERLANGFKTPENDIVMREYVETTKGGCHQISSYELDERSFAEITQ